MTTIITRVYPDLATAQAVATALMANGHAASTIDIITNGADGAAKARMDAARVVADQDLKGGSGQAA